MGFKKGGNPSDVAVSVPQPWGGADTYTFFFAKRAPREAMEAGEAYFAATGEERAEERRQAIVKAVAALSTRDPDGFDDFPRETVAVVESERGPTLTQRMTAYFDDPGEPDLERIVTAAWNFYLLEASPRAYFKSPEDSGAGSGQPSGVSSEASSVV